MFLRSQVLAQWWGGLFGATVTVFEDEEPAVAAVVVAVHWILSVSSNNTH